MQRCRKSPRTVPYLEVLDGQRSLYDAELTLAAAGEMNIAAWSNSTKRWAEAGNSKTVGALAQGWIRVSKTGSNGYDESSLISS
jgi:hypothetical protein